ncbi:OmpA family protein [Variovorax sp. VNK109]|uniref:OmpA family protein n=1 Tax=Variovorax sp. VNK109 TaxID=3400919 RepID=UPI003C01967D
MCDRIYAEIAETPHDLQAVLDRCSWNTDGFVLALSKINRLPPPAGLKPISLAPTSNAGKTVGVTLEIDVFFYLLQSYPLPTAFTRLEQLTSHLSGFNEISRVEIVGYFDENERREAPRMALNLRRAEFIRQYLEAVGIPPNAITLTIGTPRHPNTVEGRARDRSVAIKMYVWREQ